MEKTKTNYFLQDKENCQEAEWEMIYVDVIKRRSVQITILVIDNNQGFGDGDPVDHQL